MLLTGLQYALKPLEECQQDASARTGGSVNLDFAALHPGEWGRFAGLEVRKDAVELLKSMGVTAIRQGGSFADPSYCALNELLMLHCWRCPGSGSGSRWCSLPCNLKLNLAGLRRLLEELAR